MRTRESLRSSLRRAAIAAAAASLILGGALTPASAEDPPPPEHLRDQAEHARLAAVGAQHDHRVAHLAH